MKKRISFALAAFMIASSLAACAVNPTASVTASDDAAAKYAAFLEERLDVMPDTFVIGDSKTATEHGVDMTDFEDEGFFTRATDGEVLIFGKTDAGIDRAVRDFVKYGNSDAYSKTYGEGYRVEKLTIAGNDISEYAIIYDSVNQSGTEESVFPAEQLSMYIEMTCGAKLPYYTDVEFAALEEKPARTITLTVDYPALGNEAFRIEVCEDGNLTIFGGRNRGCIYGVYDLLEDIGWRFFDDILQTNTSYTTKGSGFEYLYEADHVDLTSDINRLEEPLFKSRRMDCGNSYKGYNGGNSYGGNSGYGADLYNYYSYKHKIGQNWFSGHGLSRVERFWAPFEESDQFQPCLTNELNIEKIFGYYIHHVESLTAAGHVPGRDFYEVSVGQLDGSNGFCKCESCLKVVAEEGSSSALYIRLANELSQTLTDMGYEDIPVSFLAYCETSKPPTKLKPLPNVRVAFCYYVLQDMDACNAHTLDGKDCSATSYSSNKKVSERFEVWEEVCPYGNIDVWYYPFHDGNAITGAPMVLNLYEDMKYLSEHGVGAIINTASGSSSQYGYLIEYLLNKICWQLPESYEAFLEMIREWLWLNYGDGADLLYDYLLKYEEIGKNADCYTTYYKRTSPLVYVRQSEMLTHFPYFCDLFDEARRLANTSVEEERIEHMEAGMLFLGVSHAYDDWYVNGTAEEKEFITEKYKRLHELCTKYNLRIFDNSGFAPEELDLEENPIMWYLECAYSVGELEDMFG